MYELSPKDLEPKLLGSLSQHLSIELEALEKELPRYGNDDNVYELEPEIASVADRELSINEALIIADILFNRTAEADKEHIAVWHLEQMLKHAVEGGPDEFSHNVPRSPQLEQEYHEKMQKADAQMAKAMDIEECQGIDIATDEYQKALNMYIAAHMERPSSIGLPDYTFYLRVARCQTRLAVSNVLDVKYKSPVDIKAHILDGLSRRVQLIEHAEQNYIHALGRAGAKKTSAEIAAIIFQQRSQMNALWAEYVAMNGDAKVAQAILLESQKDVLAVEYLLDKTEELEIAPDLPLNIASQRGYNAELSEQIAGNS